MKTKPKSSGHGINGNLSILLNTITLKPALIV